MTPVVFSTARLVLRGWHDLDRAPFAAMNADPLVMEFFPDQLASAQSDALIDRFEAERAEQGFCPWAVELVDTHEFIGFVGLHSVPDYLSFAPRLEVLWRLARPFWDQGYATEAASASLKFGFEQLGLEEVVSFTSVINERSRRVMERLGMQRDPTEDFEHPHVPAGPLRAHVLYRQRKSQSLHH
ncbi:MAG: hypothetical protein JWM85_3133 [Acidimicrobiaceae bacterium]|nr:hypothetical protein [Acidimicrobiaceae bacterium]